MNPDQETGSIQAEDLPTDARLRRAKLEGTLVLFSFSPDSVLTVPLPAPGEVIIGRSRDSSVVIEDLSVSRTHASICVEGSNQEGFRLSLKDLGSANGTKLRGRPLGAREMRDFDPGDPIQVGHGSVLVVQCEAQDSGPRRIWTRVGFEDRLRSECLGADAFTLARLNLAAPNTSAALVEGLAFPLLGPRDLMAMARPGAYDILIFEAPDKVLAGLRAVFEQRGMEIRVAHARFPEQGRTPEALRLAIADRPGSSVETVVAPVEPPVLEDAEMKRLYTLAERVALSDISVLILGETGVGKEVLANALHTRSQRATQPFVALNCGAMPPSLIESELFGYERGAFTGAVESKRGLIEAANGGTLFLDEIGEMPLSTQVKLLRVLEERSIRPVGGVTSRRVNVRIISATGRNLDRAAEEGSFRRDLFYRLNGITLNIPPLRARPEEVIALARYFARRFTRPEGHEPSFSPEALSKLRAHSWPGNVRELRNTIEGAVLLAGAAEILPEHLMIEASPPQLRRDSLIAPSLPSTRFPLSVPPRSRDISRRETFSEVTLDDLQAIPHGRSTSVTAVGGLGSAKDAEERDRIVGALRAAAGNQTRAAEMLGMTRRALLVRLDVLGIQRPRKGRSRSVTGTSDG